MLKEQMVVKNSTGLHARPVTTLVKLAGRYKSTIELVYNDKAIKMKSMMGLLGAVMVKTNKLQWMKSVNYLLLVSVNN